MQKKLAALAAAAALTAAVSSPAVAHDDPCPGPWEPLSASGIGGAALAADDNGDDVVCFNFDANGKRFRDNHVHSH